MLYVQGKHIGTKQEFTHQCVCLQDRISLTTINSVEPHRNIQAVKSNDTQKKPSFHHAKLYSKKIYSLQNVLQRPS